MSRIVLPTNVRLPTLLDDLRSGYITGGMDLAEFERGVEHLLATDTADDVRVLMGVLPAPAGRIGTSGEWR